MKTALEMHERVLFLEKRIGAIAIAKSDRRECPVMSNIDTREHLQILDSMQDEYIKERNEIYDALRNISVGNEAKL